MSGNCIHFVSSMRERRSGRDPKEFVIALTPAAAVAAVACEGHELCEYFTVEHAKSRLFLDYDHVFGDADPSDEDLRLHRLIVEDGARRIALDLGRPPDVFAIASRHGRKNGRFKISFRVFFEGFFVLYHDIPILLRWAQQEKTWDLAPYKRTEQLLAAIYGCKGAGDRRVLRPEPDFADRPLTDFLAQVFSPDDPFLDLAALGRSMDAQTGSRNISADCAIGGSGGPTGEEVDAGEVRAFVGMLSPARATDRSTWIGVGLVLKRLSRIGESFFELFRDFSARASEPAVVASEAELCRQWDSFREDARNPLTVSSLAHWARQDAPERYEEFIGARRSLRPFAFNLDRPSPSDVQKTALLAAIHNIVPNISLDNNAVMEVAGNTVTVRVADGTLCEVDALALTLHVNGEYRGMIVGRDVPVNMQLTKVHKKIEPRVKDFLYNREEFGVGTLVSRENGVRVEVHDPFTDNATINLCVEQHRNLVINSSRPIQFCHDTILNSLREHGQRTLPGCYQLFNNCTFVLNTANDGGFGREKPLEDTEAKTKFMEWFEDKGYRAVKCHSIFFVYDPQTGVYRTFPPNKQSDFRDFLFDKFHKCGSGILRSHATATSRMLSLVAQVRASIESEKRDELFLVNADNAMMGRIPFNNGVFIFNEGRLVDFSPDMVFFEKLPHQYPVTEEEIRDTEETCHEIMDRLVKPIWDDCSEYVLRCSARCIAMKVCDKTYFFCLGNGNSGKGVWMDAIESAFPGYVGMINNSNLLYTGVPIGDKAKHNSWMVAIRHTRFNFTSEMPMDGRLRLDGNTIKELSSGGEKLVGRQNNQDEIKFMLHGMTWTFANDVPKIQCAETDDAIHNRIRFIPMKYRYLVGDKYEKYKHKPNVRRGDDTIKQWVKTSKIGSAFAYLICKHFFDERPVAPPQVERETVEWVPEVEAGCDPFEGWLVMTDEEGAFVKSSQIWEIATEKGLTVSKIKLGKMVNDRFNKKSESIRINNKTARVFFGLAIVGEHDDFNLNVQ